MQLPTWTLLCFHIQYASRGKTWKNDIIAHTGELALGHEWCACMCQSRWPQQTNKTRTEKHPVCLQLTMKGNSPRQAAARTSPHGSLEGRSQGLTSFPAHSSQVPCLGPCDHFLHASTPPLPSAPEQSGER